MMREELKEEHQANLEEWQQASVLLQETSDALQRTREHSTIEIASLRERLGKSNIAELEASVMLRHVQAEYLELKNELAEAPSTACNCQRSVNDGVVDDFPYSEPPFAPKEREIRGPGYPHGALRTENRK